MDVSKVPTNWPSKLFEGFMAAPDVWKSALSYEIDDLPVNAYTDMARSCNSGQFTNPVGSGFFRCQTDLGIALYDRDKRGGNPLEEGNWFDSVRAAPPYTARHLDWYLAEETLREEDKYYFEQARYYSYGCWWNEKLNKNPVQNIHKYHPEEGTENYNKT